MKMTKTNKTIIIPILKSIEGFFVKFSQNMSSGAGQGSIIHSFTLNLCVFVW